MPANVQETQLSPKYAPEDYRHVEGDLYASPAVSEEDLAKWRQSMRFLETESASKKLAKFKLEVQFGRDHHVDGRPTPGVLTIWESGSKLHGGGDALLYVCPGKYNKVSTCDGVIPDALNGRAVVICPHCMTAWKDVDLIGQRFLRVPIVKWADAIYYWFIKLHLNSDIRVKYFYDDIRKASEHEQMKQLKGEVLEKARSDARRSTRIYPLQHIIKDVNAGADLHKRILAFLRM